MKVYIGTLTTHWNVSEQIQTQTSELTKRIIELTVPHLLLKSTLQDFYIKTGLSATIPKQRNAEAYGVVGRTEEEEQIGVDFKPYDTITVTPYRVSIRIPIANDIIEDTVVNVLEDKLRLLSRRMAHIIESDVEVTMRNCARVTTINRAQFKYGDLERITKKLTAKVGEQYSLMLFANPSHHNQLNKIDGIVRFSSVIPEDSIYAIATVNCGGYAPLGYFITKRPLSIEIERNLMRDETNIILSARYAPVIVYPEAILRVVYKK